MNESEAIPKPILPESIELGDNSSMMSGLMSASTDGSVKTEESVEFARPAQVASRDALDIEDTTTMLVGSETKDTTAATTTIVQGPCPLLEDDSAGSSNSHRLTIKHPENHTTEGPPLEDDSRSSFDSFKTPASRELTSSEVPPEEDSQSSFASQRSAKQRWDAVDERSAVFPAENLFEYQWPPTKLGEYYMLQEQVSEFLSVKSFKRKHPDLIRRTVDMDEKQFLRERGVVTETQCDLGLTALKSDEVLELIMRDYPEKYAEYDRVLQEKEKRNISEKHKLYSTPNIEKSKMAEFVKKAIKSAAEWNINFNRERKEERRACFDLQSLVIHYPAGKKLKLDKEATAVGQYPVSLIPGQFQDNIRRYTSAELKYYPLNTVLYGPRTALTPEGTQGVSDGSQSESDESSSSEGSSSGSSHEGTGDSSSAESQGKFHDLKNADVKPVAEIHPNDQRVNRLNLTLRGRRLKHNQTRGRGKVKEGACCVCRGKEQNKEGIAEELVLCAECNKRGHPSCLDLTRDMVPVIKSYPWQCMDCKACMHCLDPYDEDKMMFCDRCDRGYHTFCVGLKALPKGNWFCILCGVCSSCHVKRPGPEGSKAQWYHEYAKGGGGKTPAAVTVFCVACSKSRRHR